MPDQTMSAYEQNHPSKPWLYGATGLSIIAGLIHLGVTPAHFEEWIGYGLFFLVTTIAHERQNYERQILKEGLFMTMKVRRWLPIALCCLPGIVIATVVGISIAAGGVAFGTALGGPLGLGLIALALLACPLSMGLMVWRTTQQNGASSHTATMSACCMPGESTAAAATSAGEDRLAALRERHVALERELAELQRT
ncbi:MAG: hypothetical protein DYG89_11465 [Caldilinea sp. CFX5]|nr:hypothetical protein [Caldilinea sp. CFX5]